MVATYRGNSYPVVANPVGSYRTATVLTYRGVKYQKRATYM